MESLPAANQALLADDLNPKALTVERQTVKPFNAGVWSWVVKPVGSGERSAYISIEAKRADGNVISSVFPLQITVEESFLQSSLHFISENWKWIAGTVVIPFAVFLWKKIGGDKPTSSDNPQRPELDRRYRRDRRTSRR